MKKNYNLFKSRLGVPHLICYRFLLSVLFILFFTFQTAYAQQLKVMKQGLGFGNVRITSPDGTSDCGGTCDVSITTGDAVSLTATATAGSTFDRWEGNFVGATIAGSTISFSKPAGITTVRAWFKQDMPAGIDSIPELRANQVNPDSIKAYLDRYPFVNTMARFLKALPREYRQNWIPMTRSESLQTGTAKYPRILLQSGDAKNVFTIGLTTHPSFPLSHPNAIEYMQWDAATKNFRFHEIVLDNIPAMGSAASRMRGIKFDDPKCFKCHSTQNVINDSSTHIGTTGIPRRSRPNEVVKSKAKPNWDTYDSWAGMLPFNRDRIYQGSLEEKAFRHIFNLWNWRGSPLNDSIRQVIEQLELQPPGISINDRITRLIDLTTNIDHLQIQFGNIDPNTASSTRYNFGNPETAPFMFNQGGRYVTLQHTASLLDDEGRGVVLFDLLGGARGEGLNQHRVADEVVKHKWATGSHPIDVRPLALAIMRGLITINGSGRPASTAGDALRDVTAFFNARHGYAPTTNIDSLRDNTRARAQSLPRRKADLQRSNIDRTFPEPGGVGRRRDAYLVAPEDGLYKLYAGAGPGDPHVDTVRRQLFKRSIEAFDGADSVQGEVYVDREEYLRNTNKVTLLRYFLEPLGVSVSSWSMGVRARSATYTFADIFDDYERVLPAVFTDSLRRTPPQMPPGFVGPFDPNNNTHLMQAVNQSLSSLPAPNEVPRFTDVQRIFNKACVACHGGLDYPPYAGFGTLDFSEQEEPINFDGILPDLNMFSNTISPRLWRSYYWAATLGASSTLLRKISNLSFGGQPLGENHPASLMPSGGPQLSQVDIETIRRWLGGSPNPPFSLGDPHLKTIEGISYDFQADGEFVLLRGDFFEIQTRQKAVATNNQVGPNEYTGLSSCVSLNTAAALFVAGHRITYQPNLSGEPDPKGMQLRIDGELVSLGDLPKAFAPSSRIVRTSADGGIQIEGVGGTVIVLTPMYWDHYHVWYLNIDIRKARATQGLMGSIKPGNWLPALPDGTQLGLMPKKSLAERFRVLYNVFGEAWRVTDSSSLFDYAPGTSTANFTNRNWPSSGSANCVPPDEQKVQTPFTREEAERMAADIIDPERRELCIIDLMTTGEASFAKAYLAAEKISRNKYPLAPQLEFPGDFAEITGLSIKLNWVKAVDEDGDPVSYRIYVWDVNEFPDNNKALDVPRTDGPFGQGVWLCHLVLLLITLFLLILLYKLFWEKRRSLFYLLAILVLIVAALAYKYLCKDKTTTVTYTVSNLQPGKKYFWKVIAEDNNGGVTESETWRFDVK